MPKSANQKLKLLYIQKILLEETDETHALTVNQIIEKLASIGIAAERKSIYDDIDALRSFGMDVISIRSRANSYFVGSRDFELAELKLLVDAVEASRLLTAKKSLALIRKLERCTSQYNANLLQRQVFVANRIKNMRESIYYNIDKIHQAISEKKKISFKYIEWNIDKNEKLRKNGNDYCENPCGLCWDNDNYYLIAYNNKYENLVHYRVDKMMSVEILEENCDFGNLEQPFDPAQHACKYFGMFGGKEEKVSIYFDNSLVGVVLDRFGKNIVLRKSGENGFTISVDVAVSPIFFAWLLGFGTKAKIIAPSNVQKDLAKYCKSIVKIYK